MGIRARKNLLLTVLRARAIGAKMKPEEVAQFELMYRRAKTEREQDQVTSALMHFIQGWKETDEDFGRLLRIATEYKDPFGEDEDELPPSILAALQGVNT